MAEALLGWARNIIYYMVFLSLAEHLLAGSSYGRYLRLFGGLVLVLVVLGPFGSLGDWEKQVSSLFDQFTFRQESRELKKEIFGMEEKRLAGELARSNGMLSNEKFVSRAPKAKIEEERAKLEKYTQMMEQVKMRLAQLTK